MTSHTARRMAVVGGVLLAALAACGSEPQGATQNQTAGPVSTRDLPGVGTVLVDTSGKTLYFTDSDTAGSIQCVEKCMKLWIPAVAPGPNPQGGPVADIGVVQRPDGTSQLAYQNKPLYTFTLDSQDKPASGDNASDSFDGVNFTWHAVVIKPAGQPPTKTPGGGYGDGGGY